MFIHHPAIAKEWAAKYGGGGKNLPYHVGGHGKAQMNMRPTGTPSNESNAPSVTRLPRIPGFKRDFGPLHPSSKARVKLSKAASVHEVEKSSPVEHLPGSRHHKMPSIKEYSDSRLSMRDLRVANRKTITPLHKHYGK